MKYGCRITNTDVSKIPTIICKTTAPLCCVFPNEIPFCKWPAVHVGDWLKTALRHVQLVEADKWDWSNNMIYDKIFFNRKSFFQTQQADCFYQTWWSAERRDTTQTENAWNESSWIWENSNDADANFLQSLSVSLHKHLNVCRGVHHMNTTRVENHGVRQRPVLWPIQI